MKRSLKDQIHFIKILSNMTPSKFFWHLTRWKLLTIFKKFVSSFYLERCQKILEGGVFERILMNELVKIFFV